MLFAITRKDGGVSIMVLVDGDDPIHEIQKWSEIDRNDVVSVHVIKPEHVPADRTYRNAWAYDGSTFVHDMAKARELHRNFLRRDRQTKLAALDIEYQRADETDDKARKSAIVKQKQALRDAPADPSIEAATTPEELKAITLPKE